MPRKKLITKKKVDQTSAILYKTPRKRRVNASLFLFNKEWPLTAPFNFVFIKVSALNQKKKFNKKIKREKAIYVYIRVGKMLILFPCPDMRDNYQKCKRKKKDKQKNRQI